MNYSEQLKKQLQFLESSCEGYDAGRKDEAIRIATVLRILFHQTSRSTSLLTHLQAPYVKLLSTCERIPPGRTFWPNLTVIKISPVIRMAEFSPKLDTARTKTFVSFGKWWRYEKVYLIGNLDLNRRELVLSAAHTDGGAHVAHALDPQYEDLLNGAGAKMTLNLPEGDEDIPFKYGHLAALRQMGYEVLNSYRLPFVSFMDCVKQWRTVDAGFPDSCMMI